MAGGTAADRRLTVLAGPTAVGKGTVSADIRARYPEIWLSVSATTRPPRPGEVDGLHYHFVDADAFDSMIEHGDLLEWAVVHGVHRYGTPREPVARCLAAGVPAGPRVGRGLALALARKLDGALEPGREAELRAALEGSA